MPSTNTRTVLYVTTCCIAVRPIKNNCYATVFLHELFMSGLLGTTETYSVYVTASFNKVSANIVCLSLQPCLHWDYFAKVFWLLLQPAISQNCRGVRDPFSISGASLEWQWCVGKPLVYVSLLDTFRRCQLASQGTSSVVVKRSNSTMRISSSHAPAMGLIRNAVARVHMAGIGRGIVGSAKPSQSASSRQLPARLPAKTASQGVRSGCRGVGQRRTQRSATRLLVLKYYIMVRLSHIKREAYGILCKLVDNPTVNHMAV